VIVKCISFGSSSWLRPSNDNSPNGPIRSRSALMNTTAIPCGVNFRPLHRVSGTVRINAGIRPHIDSFRDALQVKFQTEGVIRYRETNRLLLKSVVPDTAEVDRFLVCVRSTVEGTIDFASEWKTGVQARILSSSFHYRRREQETLLLMDATAEIQTTLGTWRIMCKDKTSFLGLVDGQ
jgi:hypothetical protein